MALFTKEEALAYHEVPRPGKLEVLPVKPCFTQKDLSLAYSPGVAAACLAIADDPSLANVYTGRGNLVAVVSNGTAVLGLGNIGPLAGKPVMEGKSVLFKAFADVNAYDINLALTDPDKIIEVVKALEPTFGGINLEDIKAPECFYIEEVLKKEMNIPVFHDDQHGTAVVVAAALLNALKVVKKSIGGVRIVISGAGSAGTAIAGHLASLGAKDIVMVDRFGILSRTDASLSPAHSELAKRTNPRLLVGGLSDAMRDADVFIGVSAPGIVSKEMVASMNKDAIVFPMANPTPEIMPDEAKEAGARIVGTGRSDYPNQINNVLAFPGIFRGALDCRAVCINEEMKAAASTALADFIPECELNEENIIPSALDKTVAYSVAAAVAEAARRSGAARA